MGVSHFVLIFSTLMVACKCNTYQENYITLPVDQFSFTSDKTFQLRYLINDTFTNNFDDSPILFYCGNEADIEVFVDKIGFIWEFAPKIRALIVFAEHRFYGKSLPFGNSSMTGREHYGFLTIEQTLADFAALVNHLNINATSPRPVIAIGGSYGGILAALFRIKYPHLVAGALASSAPLKQFSNLTPCEKYSQIITKTFQTAYNDHCSSNIKRSWETFKDIALNGDDGVEFFNEVFNFCEPWKDGSAVNDFIYELYNVYWRMSMTNYPYEADVYTPLPANPIRKFCSHLDVEYEEKELIRAFRRALEVYTNHKGDQPCFKFPKHKLMKEFDQLAWRFQRCTEIITALCESPKDNMFPPGGENFQQAIESCRSEVGIQVDQYVNKIKNHFGVDSLRTATNIIYSNGMLDPWSAAGVLKPPNDESIVINIPEGAHHIDLRHSNELDPPSVIEAREVEQLYLKKWIRQFKRKTYNFM